MVQFSPQLREKVFMNSLAHEIVTRRGLVRFPAYIPVTTFGEEYPLDKLIQPYLSRLAPGVMVSYRYARHMNEPPKIPLFLDSGGFASLFKNARIVKSGKLGVLKIAQGGQIETIHPRDVLDLQERIADIAFTLDFPIPLGMDRLEAIKRQQLTIANARWALSNRRRRDLLLFACIQAWDEDSARVCAQAYADTPFDGIAIGGLVPRSRDIRLVTKIVKAVRAEIGNLPLHVFGLGKPEIIDHLFKAGVDSVDSSSYVKLAAEGRLWADSNFEIKDPSPTDRLHLALCNLAAATGRTLPLSASGIVFSTHSLASKPVRDSKNST